MKYNEMLEKNDMRMMNRLLGGGKGIASPQGSGFLGKKSTLSSTFEGILHSALTTEYGSKWAWWAEGDTLWVLTPQGFRMKLMTVKENDSVNKIMKKINRKLKVS